MNAIKCRWHGFLHCRWISHTVRTMFCIGRNAYQQAIFHWQTWHVCLGLGWKRRSRDHPRFTTRYTCNIIILQAVAYTRLSYYEWVTVKTDRFVMHRAPSGKYLAACTMRVHVQGRGGWHVKSFAFHEFLAFDRCSGTFLSTILGSSKQLSQQLTDSPRIEEF